MLPKIHHLANVLLLSYDTVMSDKNPFRFAKVLVNRQKIKTNLPTGTFLY